MVVVIMNRRILLIEDEQTIADLITLHLQDASVDVTCVDDGVQGLTVALREPWDLVLLDLNLPRLDGLDICQQIRHCNPETPIILITARSSEADRIKGLELGADDYVTKPFSVRELIARINALLRRVNTMKSGTESDVIVAGDIVMNMSTHSVLVNGNMVMLTAREFELLKHFAKTPGQVFKRSELLESVWGHKHEGYLHTVNTHINRLRAKIEPDPGQPSYITTVWGVGYRLSA
jgi:DNA-binding response OmpR family regulator